MSYKSVFLIILIAILTQSVFVQSKDHYQDKQRVKTTVLGFNQIVFKEMNMSKAIETHLFLGQSDSTDSKYGLEIGFDKYFEDITQDLTKKDKIGIASSGLYFTLNIPLLYWQLGTKTILSDTKFVESSIVEDKNLEKIWLDVIRKMELTEDKIDELDDIEDLKIIESLSINFNSAIEKKINQKLYTKNLAFINENMNIKEEIFMGRKYFTVESKLFQYKVAFKNNAWKIMSIERI